MGSSKWLRSTSGADDPSSADLDETIVVSKHTSSRHEPSGVTSSVRVAETAPKQTITLVIRGMRQRLALMENQSVVLGRIDPDEHLYPEVDLTAYGAYVRGVSRQHLRLTLQDGLFYITDLSSGNGTHLNGESLPPHKPYPLQNGDELLLVDHRSKEIG